MKLSVFAILLVAFVAKEVASQACHMREIDLCMAIGMFHYQSNGVPEDEEKVEEFCETYKEVMGCMGNYSDKCLSPLQKELVGLFAGADEPATRLCTPGSEDRAKYLKHAACLAEAATNDEFKAAMRDLQVSLEKIFDVPFHDRLPGLCCGLKRFNYDIDANTERSCGARP
uniref:Clone 601 transcribed RNA sequence n=1 Tax=Plectreurys tristis TaxID=33319 RepID=A0A0C4W5Q7_PLETR|nr:hypothetical protein [Plectreurys tristis]